MTANIEGVSATTDATVTESDWVLAFPVETLSLTPEDVRPISVGAASSVEGLELDLALDGDRAATIFAVGSRVEASSVRRVPDAPNTVVDTLPEEDLTAEIRTPPETDIENGTYVLGGWSVDRSSRFARPYDVTLEFLRRS